MQPFTWLARTHLLSAAGDALIAIALAGSLFFNLDPAAARPKVALYLIVTMAPFALVGPLIGPLVDRSRGGRRGMIIGAGVARAVLALLMVRHLNSLLLFPEAFGALVAGKTYHVAKSAVVPGLVREQSDLVEANSKLMLLSGLGGAIAAGPGLLLSLISSRWVLVLASVVFVLMTFPAARLPRQAIRPPRLPRREKERPGGHRYRLRHRSAATRRRVAGRDGSTVGFVLRLVRWRIRPTPAIAIRTTRVIATRAIAMPGYRDPYDPGFRDPSGPGYGDPYRQGVDPGVGGGRASRNTSAGWCRPSWRCRRARRRGAASDAAGGLSDGRRAGHDRLHAVPDRVLAPRPMMPRRGGSGSCSQRALSGSWRGRCWRRRCAAVCARKRCSWARWALRQPCRSLW